MLSVLLKRTLESVLCPIRNLIQISSNDGDISTNTASIASQAALITANTASAAANAADIVSVCGALSVIAGLGSNATVADIIGAASMANCP